MKYFTCTICGDRHDIKEHGEPRIVNRKKICDRCYEEEFQFCCPICEDYHDKQKPQHTFFYLHQAHGNLTPGYYSVLNFPVFSSDGFSVDIQESHVKKQSDNLCYKQGELMERTEFICENCFNKKGIGDNYQILQHIRKEFTNNGISTQKFHANTWIIQVSKEYFDGLETKRKIAWRWFKNVVIKRSVELSAQSIKIQTLKEFD